MAARTPRSDIDSALDTLGRELDDWHARARDPALFWQQLRALLAPVLAAADPADRAYVRAGVVRRLARARIDIGEDPAFAAWLARDADRAGGTAGGG